MQRQLQNRGGMTVGSIRQKYGLGSLVGREKFGLGSDFQDFKDKALGKVRKLIPNELADIAVKAAPFVAPFQPGIAAAMRGIGRFDQRGSISDALKQGALTYGFGRGARYLGGAEGASGGLDSYSMDNLRSGPLGNFIPGGGEKPILTKEQLAKEATKDKSGILSEKILDTTVRKIPLVDKLPKIVQEQLLVGGITAGASVLASYLQGDFREQEPGETMEDYLAERREVVGGQMRTYMDNYYKFDKEYSSKTDEQKDQFVAKYNFATGGRVRLQEGGLPTVESLGGNFVPNVRGGSIVYDLGNGSFIYKSDYGYEVYEPSQGYTSIGSTDGRTLNDLFDSGRVLRRANDPILLAQQAESNQITPDIIPLGLEEADITPVAQTAPVTTQETTQETPTGIQTIPSEKFAVNVMMDEKGNVMDDQSIPELLRQTGTAPNINNNNPINSMSDVMRLAGIENQGISEGTEYNQPTARTPGINMSNTLRQNLLNNDEQRASNQQMLQAARARLPQAGIMNAPLDVMPSSNTAGMGGGFANPNVSAANPGGYASQDEAIADLGIERYNQLYNMGGRVGFAEGTEEPLEPINIGIGTFNPERVAELYEKAKGIPEKISNISLEDIKEKSAGLGKGITSVYEKIKNPMKTLKKSRLGDEYRMYEKYFLLPKEAKEEMQEMGLDIFDVDKYLSMKNLNEPNQRLSENDIMRMIEMKDGILKPVKKAKGGMMSIPVRQNASGVKELDYRAKGGFVPVGIKEKADDVPAMLSKNEFVMTADAVRAAGGGSIEKGAQKMYNTMKQLEGRIT